MPAVFLALFHVLLSAPPYPAFAWLKAEMKVKSFSRVQLFGTPWIIARQAPPSMGYTRQEYWNGLPFPSPQDLPYPGIKPASPALQMESSPLSHHRSP